MSDSLRKEAAAFAREYATAHLATVDGNAPVVRVMHAFRVDDDLTVWFACGTSSNKVRQIRANPNASASFWESGQDLVISGTAEVMDDADTKTAMWQADWTRFFPDGPADPEYCILKITATAALYRDLERHGFEAQSLL